MDWSKQPRSKYHWLMVFIYCILIPINLVAEQKPPVEVKIAVLSYRGAEEALESWNETMAYLSSQLSDYHFVAVPLDLKRLDTAISQKEVDFAITNSGQHVQAGGKYGLSWLATLKSARHPQQEQVIGSALVVRADSEFHSLDDLKNHRLGAVSPSAFGGFQIFWGEMKGQGLSPESYFSTVRFSQFPVDALAYWVRDQLVDASVLPVCLIEDMADQGLINLTDFRVIDPKNVAGFSCQTSTKLYPNWAFSRLNHTDTELSELVTRALLDMPADSLAAVQAKSAGWTAPVSSYDIHQLYKHLDIHPLQQPWWQSLLSWVILNWLWGVVFFAVVILGFLHHLWVQIQVNRRTRQLELANIEVHSKQEQLEHAQRIAILGELASEIAHEINQPLAAISNFAEGGIVRLNRQGTPEPMSPLLERIAAEADRGARIIDRIRNFSRKDHFHSVKVDLKALLADTLKLLDYELKKNAIDLRLNIADTDVTLIGDALELQQLLVNIIRNAQEAMQHQAHRTLFISLSTATNNTIELRVEDSGVGLGTLDVDTAFKPFQSSKTGGLGLGLSICKRIVEVHKGSITLQPREAGGTSVICVFPGGFIE